MRHFEGQTFHGIKLDRYRHGSAKHYSRSMVSLFYADKAIYFHFLAKSALL
jgi:hypothetical protein